jgi:biopolymer transport protein ExbB
MTLFHFLMDGGPIMYILLPMSVIALAIGIERVIVLAREKRGTAWVLTSMRNTLRENRHDKSALRHVMDHDKKINRLVVGSILSYFQKARWEPQDLPHVLEAEILSEGKRLKDRMWALDTMITMAPLLGLLGTIMGIISSFHVMSISGLGKPAEITGGVAQALIATATGLVIAIVALLFYNLSNSVIRGIHNDLEAIARFILVSQDESAVHDASREHPGNGNVKKQGLVGAATA